MKVYDLYPRMEKLWKNVGLDLESMFDRMKQFLLSYPAPKSQEEALEYVLANPPLEGAHLDDPLCLWRAYSTLKISLDEYHNGFHFPISQENLPAALVYIVLAENEVLLLNRYPAETLRVHDLEDLEKKIISHTAYTEYNVAPHIKDSGTRLSLNWAYMRNWRRMRFKDEVFLKAVAHSLCSIVRTSIEEGIPLPDEEIEKSLEDLAYAIKWSTKKKTARIKDIYRVRKRAGLTRRNIGGEYTGIDVNPVFSIYKALEGIGSPHTERAHKLYRQVSMRQ